MNVPTPPAGENNRLEEWIKDASVASAMFLSGSPMGRVIDGMLYNAYEAYQSKDYAEVDRNQRNIRTLLKERGVII